MRKLIITLFLILSTTILAQQNQDSFWKNVRFGGGIGLGFGNNSTNIAISPNAIYDFNDSFSLGLGVGYQYAKRNGVKSNVYSVSALSLYNPFQRVQLSAEFEQLFANQKFDRQTLNRKIPALYLGLAYRVSRNLAVGVRYDTLYDKNDSVFASAFSPIFRVFF